MNLRTPKTRLRELACLSLEVAQALLPVLAVSVRSGDH